MLYGSENNLEEMVRDEDGRMLGPSIVPRARDPLGYEKEMWNVRNVMDEAECRCGPVGGGMVISGVYASPWLSKL
jgi:hypothetical protein